MQFIIATNIFLCFLADTLTLLKSLELEVEKFQELCEQALGESEGQKVHPLVVKLPGTLEDKAGLKLHKNCQEVTVPSLHVPAVGSASGIPGHSCSCTTFLTLYLAFWVQVCVGPSILRSISDRMHALERKINELTETATAFSGKLREAQILEPRV